MLQKGCGAGRPPTNSNGEKDPPLLQSARVKRELKTIVPPKPSHADLPDEGVENVVVVHVTAKTRDEAPMLAPMLPDDDDHTVTSITSASTTASKLDGQVYYHYPTFPERMDPKLFGTGPVEMLATSEVTTFTVFFMTFTAVMGKDLMAVDGDSLDRLDKKDIVSDLPREDEDDGACHIANLVDEIVMDADLPQTPTKKDKLRLGKKTPQKNPVRHRFNDKLSTLKIMEALETARAELVIAFEMLKMMKERGLKADPEAYQCLIDACGRCGDTGRATQLLWRMHEDGIVADGVVYSSLVSAFSADNAWKQASGEAREELPDWANGASIDMDWNALKVQKRSYLDIMQEKLGAAEGGDGGDRLVKRGVRRIVSWRRGEKAERSREADVPASYAEQYVTDQVLRQILLGENLLEIMYPDISIDTDNKFCPRCNYELTDDDVVAGWSAGNSQEYKTQCPNCLTTFVPHFCVQSTLPSFAGSRSPSSALFCERLSPWVLQKELRSVVSSGMEGLLSPEWRERESKNVVLWWNLILSFMRYRFPFTFKLPPDDE